MKALPAIALYLLSSAAFAAPPQPSVPAVDVQAQQSGVIQELVRERDEAQKAALNYAAQIAQLQSELQKLRTPQPKQ